MDVAGIKTNIPLHRALLLDSHFIKGAISIHYLEERLDDLSGVKNPS
jgi:acetyl-CoA carboxylase biotin carboxylase subunit